MPLQELDANVPRGPRVSDVPIKKPGMFAPERLAGITLCPYGRVLVSTFT